MKFSTLFTAVVTISILLYSACASPSLKGKTYAFIYGISDYSGYAQMLQLNAADLEACQYDAQSMAAALQSAYGNTADIYLRLAPTAGFSGNGILSEHPDKARLLADFDLVAQTAGPEDRFLFFYAGHGISIDASSVNENDWGEYGEFAVTYSQREYLCLALPESSSTQSISAEDVFFSDTELREALADLPCGKKFILLDSCHSGGMISVYPDINASIMKGYSHSSMYLALKSYFSQNENEINAHKNTWILAAAAETGSSYESSAIGHGVFTYFLLKAFQDGDRNRDNYISWSELTAYTATASQSLLNQWDETGNMAEFGDMLVSCGSGSEDVLFIPVSESEEFY